MPHSPFCSSPRPSPPTRPRSPSCATWRPSSIRWAARRDRVTARPRARTDSSSPCAATIRSSTTRRCSTISRAAASIAPIPGAASCSPSRRRKWRTAADCASKSAPTTTRPSYNWIAQGVPFGDPATDTVRRLEVEPKEIFMKAPGESARIKVTAIYADGGSRDVTGSGGSREQRPRRGDGRRRRGEGRAHRRGHRHAALSGQPRHPAGDRAESQAGLRLEAPAAEQLHRPHDRRQAAAPQDPAVAGGGRCGLPAPRLARPHRPVAHSRGSARLRRGCVQDQAQHPDRQADRQLGVRRSLDAEVGRPAAEQSQVSGRKRRVRVPRMDPRFHRAEQALRPHGARDADGARQFLRESRGQFLPRDARPQAHHGEDHAGLPRRPHGVRAVPRPPLRALDAEPVLRNGGILLGRRTAARLRSGRRDPLRPAPGFRHEAPQGRPRDESEVHPAGHLLRRAERCLPTAAAAA